MTRKQVLVVVGLGLVFGVTYWLLRSPWPEHDGDIRQVGQLAVNEVRRGAEGTVELTVMGHALRHEDAFSFLIEEVEPTRLVLVDGAGKAVAIAAKWRSRGGAHTAKIKLPEVPDGDYLLRAEYETDLGKGEVEMPLALYAPARVHVLTDRPLYEPGNTVKVRAVVVRAADLAPIDHRPGLWVVTDPDGAVVLEEKASAKDFGVLATSFPLDRAAPTGVWKVRWQSGGDQEEVAFQVAPFTLPRFRVEAQAELPFYSPNDPATLEKKVPRIKGAVTYSSGAPVSNAQMEITWRLLGDWPPPSDWQDKLLPKRATAGGNGAFELVLPPLPADLQGQVTLEAMIVAIDPAGDRVGGSAKVLLSEHGILVSAVTELGGGLVNGFNNRVYLRATTPDGRVLQGATLHVRRAWEETDPGISATVDEDGVAALQLDPGPPVNVVIPARPYRPARRPPLVERGDVTDLIAVEEAPVADQLELDRWLSSLAPCAKWVSGDEEEEVELALRVGANGAIVAAGAGPAPLARCALATVRGRRLSPGRDRLYAVPWTFRSPDLATLEIQIEDAIAAGASAVNAALEAALKARAADARGCLPADDAGALPRALTWRIAAGSRELSVGDWVPDPNASASAAAMACVASRFAGVRVTLDEPVTSDAMGVARFSVQQPPSASGARPQPTTTLGYELAVSADTPGRPSTKLRLSPGEIPALRLRLSPTLASPGEKVIAELIRGPSFAGELPKKLALACDKHKLDAKLEGRQATFVLPATVEGWCQVRYGDARSLLYVRPHSELAVAVTPSAKSVAPGQKVDFLIRTTAKGKGEPAAVGLFGVDESLSQLVPLPGVDELARLAPKIDTPAPAFGELDAQALTMGRIVGANAAAAVILRAGEPPASAELDAIVSAQARAPFDPDAELIDSFYTVLAELHVQARAWEASAPAQEKMRPATMAKLWSKAIGACAARGERVKDAFGRTLRLRTLPSDLLAMVDPMVVVSGERQTEDVENWAAWVAKERP